MGALNEKEFEQAREDFIKNATDAGAPRDTIEAVSGYMLTQINEATRLGYTNQEQHSEVLKKAVEGLYILIFCNHYTPGKRLIFQKPLFYSARNYMFLMFSRVYQGRDRFLTLEEIRSKQPILLGNK